MASFGHRCTSHRGLRSKDLLMILKAVNQAPSKMWHRIIIIIRLRLRARKCLIILKIRLKKRASASRWPLMRSECRFVGTVYLKFCCWCFKYRAAISFLVTRRTFCSSHAFIDSIRANASLQRSVESLAQSSRRKFCYCHCKMICRPYANMPKTEVSICCAAFCR